MSDTQILKADVESWYTRLNAIRVKHGLTAFTQVPSTASGYPLVRSDDMKTLETRVSSTRTEEHLTSTVAWVPSTTINVGQKILLATKTAIEATLTSMEAPCHHDANNSNYSNNGYDGDYNLCDATYTHSNYGSFIHG